MVKKNKLFKNKLQMIIYILLMIIILILFIVIGKHDFNKNISTEAEQFNQIFTNVPKENVFKFSNAQEVNNIINSKKSKGIILFGFKANNWTSYYAEYIDEVAKEMDINEVLYYDFESDRKDKNGTYETIVNSLSVYTKYTDYNTSEIYAPTLLVVKNGEILLYDDSTAVRSGNYTPDIYWQDYQIEDFKSTLRLVFAEYLKEDK